MKTFAAKTANVTFPAKSLLTRKMEENKKSPSASSRSLNPCKFLSFIALTLCLFFISMLSEQRCGLFKRRLLANAYPTKFLKGKA